MEKVLAPRRVLLALVHAVLEDVELVVLEHLVHAASQGWPLRLARAQYLVLKGVEDLHVRASGLLVVHLLHQAGGLVRGKRQSSLPVALL